MIAKNLASIQDRIHRAAEAVGRNPEEITLVAVSKTFSADHIRQAYDAGQRHFGESKFQEAVPKIEGLPEDIVWHFIGKLQSNKAKRAAEYFHVLHTLETSSQLKELDKAAKVVDALIEVNIAEEPQKSGILPGNIDRFQKEVLQCKKVHLRGLMTIGPVNPNAEQSRLFFRTMRQLVERIGDSWLSMGMSNDFEVGVQEGATHVRVGSAIFGER